MGELIEFQGIRGYLAQNGEPGLVVLHEWYGLVPHIVDVADRFAKEGFTTLAPDLYHGVSAPNEEPGLAERLQMQVLENRLRAVSECRSAVKELRARGCPKVGVVGFCTGGALALAVSGDLFYPEWPPTAPVFQERLIDATVAFYGIFPQSGENSIVTPVLVHVAEREEHNWPALPEHFPKWFAGMDNVELHIYPGTGHGFFNDTFPRDNIDEAAADLAWERTLRFLRQHLA